MTYTKLLELEEKFTVKIAQQNDNVRFQEQRDRLSKFFHKLTRELKALVSEMGGDIVVLKEKDFDSKILDVFKEFRNNIIYYTKMIEPSNPYEGANKLIGWMQHRMNKATLDNLDYIIQDFLRTNEVDFKATPFLKQSRVESLRKLSNLLRVTQKYIEENPMLPDPRSQSTIPPPMLYNVKEESGSQAGPESETIPGIPSSKKEKEAI